MRHPVDNVRITQLFGANYWYYKKFGLKGHNGIDYAVPNGTAIRAAFSGKITSRGKDKYYGIYTRVRNDGYEAIYCHNRSNDIPKGTWVKEGQKIATSDNTGLSTGPHVHFAVRPINGINGGVINYNNGYHGYIDPMPLINSKEKPMAKIYWADFVGQGFVNDKGEYIDSSHFYMKTGEKKDLWFEAKNAGNVAWPVHDMNSVRVSARGFAPFAYGWITPERITEAEKFYWPQKIIKPGELVKFRATFKAPDYPTELKDWPVYMLMENAAWFNDYLPVFKINFSIGDKPRLRQVKGEKTVWWLSNGEKHRITAPGAAQTWFGSDWTKAVQPISRGELDKIKEGQVLK